MAATATKEKIYCKSGDGCTKNAIPSTVFPGKSLFCQRHQEQLDEIRKDFQERSKIKGPKNKKNVTQENFCEGCGTGRPIYGERLCAECSGET